MRGRLLHSSAARAEAARGLSGALSSSVPHVHQTDPHLCSTTGRLAPMFSYDLMLEVDGVLRSQDLKRSSIVIWCPARGLTCMAGSGSSPWSGKAMDSLTGAQSLMRSSMKVTPDVLWTLGSSSSARR